MSTSTLARRVSWTGPAELVVEERRSPQSIGANEVVIRVDSIGVCGTDLSIWRGNHPDTVAGTVLGHEFGGTIVETGASVSDRIIGELVAVDPNITCGQCRECATGSRGLRTARRLMGN